MKKGGEAEHLAMFWSAVVQPARVVWTPQAWHRPMLQRPPNPLGESDAGAAGDAWSTQMEVVVERQARAARGVWESMARAYFREMEAVRGVLEGTEGVVSTLREDVPRSISVCLARLAAACAAHGCEGEKVLCKWGAKKLKQLRTDASLSTVDLCISYESLIETVQTRMARPMARPIIAAEPTETGGGAHIPELRSHVDSLQAQIKTLEGMKRAGKGGEEVVAALQAARQTVEEAEGEIARASKSALSGAAVPSHLRANAWDALNRARELCEKFREHASRLCLPLGDRAWDARVVRAHELVMDGLKRVRREWEGECYRAWGRDPAWGAAIRAWQRNVRVCGDKEYAGLVRSLRESWWRGWELGEASA